MTDRKIKALEILANGTFIPATPLALTEERKFDDAAKTMIDTLREFKHYEDDEFVNDIKIEIVNGDTCTVIC